MRQERKLRHKKVLLTGGPLSIVYCVHRLLKRTAFFERLKTCVYSPGGVAGFADSLRNLAQSLAK